MLIITDNLNEWSMLEKAIDFLKESLVKDEDYEEPMYITKADPPMLILDQEKNMILFRISIWNGTCRVMWVCSALAMGLNSFTLQR